jgi:alginate O-acetyltransferase complex protein AlgI
MFWLILVFVLTGVFTGFYLSRIQSIALKRSMGWFVLITLVFSTDRMLIEASAFYRMLGICCVLLGSMKGLVYAEWAGKLRLSLPRYCIFAFCWFGMDVGSFTTRRQNLSWKSDISIGLCAMLLGLSAAWLVWLLNLRQILLVFVPLSLAFHFGALRALKGGLRFAGYPVRTLFPNVFMTQGIADFWSKRWNVGYSQMMQRVVFRPIAGLAGKDIGFLAVFVISGVLHELAITLPVQTGYGLPTAYFALHGLLVLIEKKSGRSFGKISTLLLVVLPLGWLFPSTFKEEVLLYCLSAFELFS